MNSTDITILHREPSAHVSTSFNEIVTCRLADGSTRRLLLKRGVSHADTSYGHHGGVPYEATVYRSVLGPLATTAPRFHDSYVDAATGETVLLIDFLENATRLSDTPPATYFEAARWIGAFHRVNEGRAEALAHAIQRYDRSHYLGWMTRALDFWGEGQGGWLTVLGRHWEALAAELLAAPQTLIHGEYYPRNILVHDNVVAPVDWETASIGPGEIDLVALTERWPAQHIATCQTEYCHSRWPEGAPPTFPRRVALAKVYLQLRWLGLRRNLSRKEASDRLGRLRGFCDEIGLAAD